MEGILLFFNLLGGLGVFLLGIKMMSDGLQKAAGNRLRKIISGATGNRFTATFSGILVTSIIQSSSATTVMVVGFVSAGLLTLTQSLGVIFGANIGTTTTAWIISLLGFKVDIALFAMPMIGLGFFSQFVSKWPIVRRIGEAMLGFGLLFLGLSLIKSAIPDVQSSSATIEWITKFRPDTLWSLLAVVGVGTGLTVIFQSSSAVMAVTLTCAAKGLIDYPTACALVLGENIGTTITANIAAIGAPRAAKRAALGHMMFNILGVIWAIALFHPLLSLVDWIVPGTTEGTGSEVLLVSIPYHLSAFHTTFNIINTCVMLVFIKQFEKLIMMIMPLKRSEEEQTDLVYLKAGVTATPELFIEAARREVDRMAGLVESIISKDLHAIKTDSPKLFERSVEDVHAKEKASDVLEYKINDFLKNLTHDQLSRDMITDVMAMFDLTNYLEKMADHGDKIAILLNKARSINAFEQQDYDKLETIGLRVKKILKDTRATILNYDMDKERVMQLALERERELNEMRHSFRDDKTSRDFTQQQLSPVAITLYTDILTSFEKIGDYALNIVETTTGVRDKMLKEGRNASVGGKK
ncbi:Na/Pi cotransporter family protein [Candidatus Proelusimicrobium volucris]|uniref:Na/Pi cotransporter family protein n=1 Tax=Candidatus Proelusimicrobium volucris TaxID=3416225 RepID=UPI003D115BC5